MPSSNPASFKGPSQFELLRSVPAIMENPMEFIQQAVERYGDFVRFKAGAITAVILNDPGAIKHVLQDNYRNYTKDTFQYNALAQVTGRGLLTSDGEFWRRQRKIMQPAFINAQLKQFGPAITAAVERMLQRWQPYVDSGEVVDVDEEMMRLTLEIVGQTLFSMDLSQEAPTLTKAVIVCLDHIMQNSRQFSLLKFIPSAQDTRFKEALKLLDRAVFEIIEQRRKYPHPSPQDLLDMLLSHLDESGAEGMTLKQVRDEVITLLIAGHETVASALTWTLYLLSRHPAVMLQMKEELDSVLNGRLPAVEDLENLPYTRMVFDETLRLYPPAWLITRRAVAEDEVEAGVIPAGAIVIIGTSAIHRHPRYWQNPEKFDPLHFSAEQKAGRPRFAYIPFGGGPRICIGNNFALMEAPLILAAIYQRVRPRLQVGARIRPEPLVTIRPANGMPMTLHRG